MIIPDVNLLIYAYNAAHPFHPLARDWWEKALTGTTPVGLCWVTISGFLRLMTNLRMLKTPMPTAEAVEVARSWLEQSPVLMVEPGKKFPQLFFGSLERLGLAGNLTTDAYLAALAIEHQAELHSCDADFSRFAGLRWRNPIVKAG